MKNTKKAFNWIIYILDRRSLRYRITDGLAAQAYGARRPLVDIDIEIDDADMIFLIEDVKHFILFGPARYVDNNWDLQLMTLRYMEQEIDIAGVNSKIFNRRLNQWEIRGGAVIESVRAQLFGREVFVEPMESVVWYKHVLSRAVDIQDIQEIVAAQNNLKL